MNFRGEIEIIIVSLGYGFGSVWRIFVIIILTDPYHRFYLLLLLQNSKIKSLVKTEAKVLPMTPEQEKQRKLEKRKNKLRYCNWHRVYEISFAEVHIGRGKYSAHNAIRIFSVAEPKLFVFGSSSGSTFSIILAPAPALYCHFINFGSTKYKLNIIKIYC